MTDGRHAQGRAITLVSTGRRRGGGGHPSTGAALVLLDQFGVTNQLAGDRLAAVEHLELAVLDADEPDAAGRADLPEVCVAEVDRLAGESGRVVEAAVGLADGVDESLTRQV